MRVLGIPAIRFRMVSEAHFRRLLPVCCAAPLVWVATQRAGVDLTPSNLTHDALEALKRS
jgi:hypothetical protein